MKNKRTYYKAMVLGDFSVGKTALIDRCINNELKKIYFPSLGCNMEVKDVNLDGYETLAILFDVSGVQSLLPLRKKYYPNSDGALVVFDITRSKTFNNIPNWIEEFFNNNGRGIVPIVLVGNKSDLRDENSITTESALEYATELSKWAGFEIPYFETSALDGSGVEEAFLTLVKNMIIQKQKGKHPPEKQQANNKKSMIQLKPPTINKDHN